MGANLQVAWVYSVIAACAYGGTSPDVDAVARDDVASESLSYQDQGCDGWEALGKLNGSGDVDAAVLLPDGRVFAVGMFARSPQIFDPRTGTSTQVAPAPWSFLSASAALVTVDRVIVVGSIFVGEFEPGVRQKRAPQCYLFDLGTNRWRAISCPTGWSEHVDLAPVVTALQDGRAVAFDGVTSVALYRDDLGVWEKEAWVTRSVTGHSQVVLDGTRVLIAGGGKEPAALMYDATSGVAQAVVQPPLPIWGALALKLLDGRVLFAGLTRSKASASTLFFDPTSSTWSVGPELVASHAGLGGTVLADGTVVLAGGWDANRRRVPVTEVLRPGGERWEYGGTSCEPRTHPIIVGTAHGPLLMGGLSADAYASDGGETFGFTARRTTTVERWSARVDSLGELKGPPPKTLHALTEEEARRGQSDGSRGGARSAEPEGGHNEW